MITERVSDEYITLGEIYHQIPEAVTSREALNRHSDHPISSRRQERILFSALKCGTNVNLVMSQLISPVEELGRREHLQWVRFLEYRGDKVINIIYGLYHKLVFDIAKKIRLRTKSMEEEDLVQEGYLGLRSAIEKFDIERGYKFSTYATWWIRQAMGRAVMDTDNMVKIPVHIIESLGKLARAKEDYVQEFGYEPTTLRQMFLLLEKYPDMRPGSIVTVVETSESHLLTWDSIDVTVREDQNNSLISLLGEEDTHYSTIVGEEEKRGFLTDLEEACRSFAKGRRSGGIKGAGPDTYFKLLSERFGLNRDCNKTLEKTGKELGVTRERVRQVVDDLLIYLRDLPEIKRYGIFVNIDKRGTKIHALKTENGRLRNRSKHTPPGEIVRNIMEKGMWDQIPYKTKEVLKAFLDKDDDKLRELGRIYNFDKHGLDSWVEKALDLLQYQLTA